ncbi:MAG TPA: hypothetical protein VGI97_03915, partial [Gemmatimonadaceae bacterium]|jgi:hypothetical protein
MRTIAGLALLLLLVACDRSPTAPASRLLVTAYATPDTVRAGDDINVIVAITNVSDQAQMYETNFCGPAYRVFDAAGADLSSGGACAAYSQIKTLAPGAQDVYSSMWTSTSGSTAAALPAGTYTIRGVTAGDGVENLPYTVQLVP